MLQVMKGFDWLSSLVFDDDDMLVAGFHAVRLPVACSWFLCNLFSSKLR